ncbi:YqaA family protein [Falsirhodobacter xinxiangensis]|uniref:YqaA family protein n=1 Tax=Falsirhodobacter xinxiangensis TaxID=2530049 RepID=UPI0010AAAFEE|nr:YqaA family protein [Rhodobacter xinxiangensis]
MDILTPVLGLFSAAFLAATLLPAQSEALLYYLVRQGEVAVPVLFIAATAGNVLGSMVNWGLGRELKRFEGRRWFPVTPARRAQAEGWYRKWGRWSLLLTWVPVIGDPLALVAGVLREPFWTFVLLVTVSKAGRYLLILAIA